MTTQTEALKIVVTGLPATIEDYQLALNAAFAGGKALGEALAQQSNEQVEPVAFLYQTSFYQPDKDDGMRLSFNIGTAEVNAMPDTIKPLFPHPPVPYVVEPRTAQPEQEEKLPPVEIGVDVTKEGTAVTAFYRRPNDVMEMFYSEFHPLAQPKEPEQEPVAIQYASKAERDLYEMEDEDDTTPPQRTWVGLTHEKRVSIIHEDENRSLLEHCERIEEVLKGNNA